VITPEQDISDVILCGFVLFMALSGKHKSIRTYLSMGPRILVEGFNHTFKKPSERPMLRRVLKSIDRIWGKATTRKAPVTIAHLKAMAKLIHPHSSQLRKTVWAAMLLAFFSLVRKSAYCAKSKTTFDPIRQLTVADLSVINGRAQISLQLTKTLQYSERDLEILLPLLNNIICPTSYIADMLEKRTIKSQDEPLFVVDKYNTPLTESMFGTEFRKLLTEADIATDDKAPHSLRRGGTTCALECGCNPTCIKVQGDWVSDAYMIYIWVTDTLKRQVIDSWETFLR